MEKKKSISKNENLLEELKAFGESIAAIPPPGEVTKPNANYYVRSKGKLGSGSMELKWGEINLPKMTGHFTEYFDFVKVYRGQYQFFKEFNFQGQSLTVSAGETWRQSSDFRFKEIKSWRSI